MIKMTDFRITEGCFLSRSGKVVVITDPPSHSYTGWQGHIVFGSIKKSGRWNNYGRYYDSSWPNPLDIVEKLPDKKKQPLTRCDPRNPANREFAPTAEASDGKKYPVEWFMVQQRFEDVTPPDGVDLDIFVNGIRRNSPRIYQLFDGVIFYGSALHGRRKSALNDITEKICWTLSPLPPKLKEEVNVWDKYVSDYGTFSATGIKMTAGFVKTHSQEIDALYAWKNHLISQDEVEL